MAETRENTINLENGIPESDLADGAMLVGQVGEEAVLLARRGAEVFAIGAACTHYGGPLGEGLMDMSGHNRCEGRVWGRLQASGRRWSQITGLAAGRKGVASSGLLATQNARSRTSAPAGGPRIRPT